MAQQQNEWRQRFAETYYQETRMNLRQLAEEHGARAHFPTALTVLFTKGFAETPEFNWVASRTPLTDCIKLLEKL